MDQVEHLDRKNAKQSKNRDYFFITLLRDPLARFLSEFKHVQRGATWKSSRHWCDGRLPTPKEITSCFKGPNWRNVSLEEFISCPHNLAFNRQTRMLADLSLIGCYNRSAMTDAERNSILLFSAKQNLKRMAFFGLCEEQLITQYLFEQTFNIKFKRPFVQFNQTRSHEVFQSLNYKTITKIKELNHLDVALYSYAKELFRKRFAKIKEHDPNFDNYYRQLLNASELQLKKNKLARFNKLKLTNHSIARSALPAIFTSTARTLTRMDDDNHDSHNGQTNTIDNYYNAIEDGGYDETSSLIDSNDDNDSVDDYYV